MLGSKDAVGSSEVAWIIASVNLLFKMWGNRNGSLEDDLNVWASTTLILTEGISASILFIYKGTIKKYRVMFGKHGKIIFYAWHIWTVNKVHVMRNNCNSILLQKDENLLVK